MKHNIDVEGLPEGWKALAYRPYKPGDRVFRDGKVVDVEGYSKMSYIILEKIQPRRIVLEETEEYHEPEDKTALHTQIFNIDGVSAVKIVSNKIWREIVDVPSTDKE